MKLKSLSEYFSKTEMVLWSGSALFIIISFLIFDRTNFLTLSASLIGVTSLILNAKGNPIGQLLMIIFSILYGIISFSFAYYGEMITYLLMTAPMALLALISWLRHPYKGKRSQVEVGKLSKNEIWFMLILSLAVTIVFYYVLAFFDTANLLPSTLSVITSFIAAYLTFRRSPFFCPCLCRKRYSFNCFMDTCNRKKYIIFFCYNLLCYVSCERFIRLYKLA